MIAGLVFGHAQAMTGQAIGFLVIDRLALPPTEALQPTGHRADDGRGRGAAGAMGADPAAQPEPRAMMLVGLVIGAAGCALTGLATSLYGIATAYALASVGFGFARPAFTAGSSWRSGRRRKGRSRARSPAINGASFVLGPSIGVGLYEAQHSLPYLTAGAACLVLVGYCWLVLRPGREA